MPTISIRTDVDVDVEDVLSSLSIDEWERARNREDARRSLARFSDTDTLELIETALRENRVDEALLLLERTTRPKFKSAAAAEIDYAAARKTVQQDIAA